MVVQNMFTTKEAKNLVKKVLVFEKSNQMYSMHKGIAFALQGFHVLRYKLCLCAPKKHRGRKQLL